MPAAPIRRSAIPAEQRVFSLILALVASPQGLTKRDLLSSVYGYADRYRYGIIDPTLERQFERDKDQVRSLGIPIETLDSPEEPGNTQLSRYRIAKAAMLVPADLRLSAEELTLLRLASLAWAEGSLSVESRRAAMKLAALGAGIETRHLGVAPSLGITEPQAPAVQRAIDSRRYIEFEYQMPERTQTMLRRVAPLRLHRTDGRWHLISWDPEREQTRVFLLSRMRGEVRVLNTRVSPDYSERVTDVINELNNLRDTQQVRVRVRVGSIAQARLSSRAEVVTSHTSPHEPTGEDSQDMLIGTLDTALFAEELAGYGFEVRVLEPADMRARVRKILCTVASQHSEVGVTR